MAGLGRIQQRFNAAVVGALAALVAFARQGGDSAAAQTQARGGVGHPIHAKYLRPSDPARVRTRYAGKDYSYCMGVGETLRRRRVQTGNRDIYQIEADRRGVTRAQAKAMLFGELLTRRPLVGRV